MSDNSLFTATPTRKRLIAEVTRLQLKGAGLAAAVFFGLWLMVGAFNWVGVTLLPAESQLAADPAPAAFANMPDQ